MYVGFSQFDDDENDCSFDVFNLKQDGPIDPLDLAIGIRNVVQDIASDLAGLARSFHNTGNRELAARLNLHARELRQVPDAVHAINHHWVSDMSKTAQQHTASILEACLAGVFVAKNPDTEKG